MKWLIFILFISTLFAEEHWAEKTLATMSQEEKIAQLFLIAAYVDESYAQAETGFVPEVDQLIAQYPVGGLVFVGPSSSVEQVALTNQYQTISKYPLLIAQDLEWGLSMRLKDGMNFPKNMTLAAVQDNQLIYEMGREIGEQARRIGVHMNLSPVLDVNREAENLSINVRSFGSSPKLVAEKGDAMIRGLQDAGLIASAKHFPGLGDIVIDPHLGLPHSLRDPELYPFIRAIEAGVLSIQVEHLLLPALDPDIPSSLSPKIVRDLLKGELGFTGLVLSGALRMKAVADHFPEEELILKAFLAGNDMLMMPPDLAKAHQILKRALLEGKISEAEVDERVLKILQLKEKLQLHRQRTVPLPTREELHPSSAEALKKRLYQEAVTWLRQARHLFPPYTYVQLGGDALFLPPLPLLDSFFFSFDKDPTQELETLLQHLKEGVSILLAVYPADPRRIVQIRLQEGEKQVQALQNFCVHGILPSFLHVIEALQPYQSQTIVILFGSPFALPFFASFETLIMAHEPDRQAQGAAFQLLSCEQ